MCYYPENDILTPLCLFVILPYLIFSTKTRKSTNKILGFLRTMTPKLSKQGVGSIPETDWKITGPFDLKSFKHSNEA